MMKILDIPRHIKCWKRGKLNANRLAAVRNLEHFDSLHGMMHYFSWSNYKVIMAEIRSLGN